MSGRLALLLVCSWACLAYCSSQAISLPGGHPAAPTATATDQKGRSAGPRGFQAALAAKRDRRHLKKLERQSNDYAGQTNAAALQKEIADLRETYNEETDTRQAAPEQQHLQLFPLIALAVAAFAVGVLLGYELGRSRSTSPFETPNQPIPAMLGASPEVPKEEYAQSPDSALSPSLDHAISQASEKQKLRQHARAAAAAIESSSDADPKLFASAAGMQNEHKASEMRQAEHSLAARERRALQMQSTGDRSGDDTLDPELVSLSRQDGRHVTFSDSAVLESSSSPTVCASEGQSQDAHQRQSKGITQVLAEVSEPGLQDSPMLSSAASAPAESSAQNTDKSLTATKEQDSSSRAQPESTERVPDRDYQASTSGCTKLMSMQGEPDMLQSMQWVANSSGSGDGRLQSEHWDRATAFWAAFTSKLDVSRFVPKHHMWSGQAQLSSSSHITGTSHVHLQDYLLRKHGIILTT